MTLRQRQPRVQDRAFLAFVRRQPCVSCHAAPPSQAMHIRGACPERDKRETGKGEKPSDRWCLAGCARCHLDGPQALHKVGEAAFFKRLRIDPFHIATMLYAQFLASFAHPRLIKIRKRNANKKPQKKRAVSRPITKRKHPWPKRAFPAGRKIGGRR